MGFRTRKTDSPRVDLTPMVDVVFLLLIFFMISTTFIEKPGLTVNLPKSSSEQIINKQLEVRVYLQADGKIYLEKQEIGISDLIHELNNYGDKAAENTFLLMADKDVRHGKVVELMDAAKAAGFIKLSIATEKKQ